MAREAVMDEGDFLRRLGGDGALAGELASVLTATLPGLEASLAEAVRAGRGVDVSRAAHAIKGAVATFSATRAVAAARRLEAMGREQPSRLAHALVDPAHKDLEEALADLVRLLGARFGSPSP